MKDGIIKGTGNSRFLKSVENFKTLYPTYDAFVTALVAGTLPIDFNGINADGWEQIGNALGKNTLLKNATAEALGLSDAALPDDALRILSRLHAGLGNEYLWAVTSNDWGIAEEGEQLVVVSKTNTVYYSDSYILSSDGVLSLVNPSSLTLGYESTPALHGKYVSFTTEYSTGNSPTGNIFGLCTSTYAGGQMMPDLTVKIMKAVQSGEIIKYVNSPNPNAYPVNDGYTYTALGMLGAFGHKQTGSYKGTGSGKVTLTFNFEPKMVIVTIGTSSTKSFNAIFVNPNPRSYTPYYAAGSGYGMLGITWGGNSITFGSYTGSDSSGGEHTMNWGGETYYYIAIG